MRLIRRCGEEGCGEAACDARKSGTRGRVARMEGEEGARRARRQTQAGRRCRRQHGESSPVPALTSWARPYVSTKTPAGSASAKDRGGGGGQQPEGRDALSVVAGERGHRGRRECRQKSEQVFLSCNCIYIFGSPGTRKWYSNKYSTQGKRAVHNVLKSPLENPPQSCLDT